MKKVLNPLKYYILTGYLEKKRKLTAKSLNLMCRQRHIETSQTVEILHYGGMVNGEFNGGTKNKEGFVPNIVIIQGKIHILRIR